MGSRAAWPQSEAQSWQREGVPHWGFCPTQDGGWDSTGRSGRFKAERLVDSGNLHAVGAGDFEVRAAPASSSLLGERYPIPSGIFRAP